MSRRVYLMIAVACAATLAAPALADRLIVDGKEIANVSVLNFTDGKLTVRVDGKYTKYEIQKVQLLELKGEDALNQAEKLLAEGKQDEALKAYEVAVKKTKGPWHIALAKKRLEQAKSGVIGATSQPTAQSQPTSAPATATSKPVVTGEPLSSPAAMLAACETMPDDPRQAANWETLGESDRSQAVREYNTLMDQWNKQYRFKGQSVRWTLTLVSAKKEGQFVILGLSDGQVTATVTLSGAASDAFGTAEAGKKCLVNGTLSGYTFQRGQKTIFMTSDSSLKVTIEQAYLGDKPPQTQPESTTASVE